MAEKSGTTPMLDTIISISSLGTTRRISASTCCTFFSVRSSPVPEAAFRLMTNWPASVAGKKAEPRKGKISRLAAAAPSRTATTVRGNRSIEPSTRS